MDAAKLLLRYEDLNDAGQAAIVPNTRIGCLAAAEKFREAAMVADLIGGAQGAFRRASVGQSLSACLGRLGDTAAAASAACTAVRAGRASGNRTALVSTLCSCGDVARYAPDDMASAERESREQERRSGSPSYGGLDLSQEGRISLPTTPAAVSRLSLAYNEAAVDISDAALAAAGGRDSRAATDYRRVPLLRVEARARSGLGDCLHDVGEEPQRSSELLRQAVALLRQAVRTAAPGDEILNTQGMLADHLSHLGIVLCDRSPEGVAEAEACLREALALAMGFGDVFLRAKTLKYLINLRRGARKGGACRGRGVPLAAEPALCPDGQIARDELLDLPRASRATSRRHSRRRCRCRWQRRCRRSARLVCPRIALRSSVPPRLLHGLAEARVPPLQGRILELSFSVRWGALSWRVHY